MDDWKTLGRPVGFVSTAMLGRFGGSCWEGLGVLLEDMFGRFRGLCWNRQFIAYARPLIVVKIFEIFEILKFQKLRSNG